MATRLAQRKLVMATGLNAPPQNAGEFFAWGNGDHVVDASSGQRVATVCDGIDSYYPPVAAGTLCMNGSVSKVGTWEGHATSIKSTASCGPINGALSPDGARVGARISPSGSCGVSSVSLVSLSGGISATPAVGTPQGWIDGTHLVVGPADGGQPEASGTIYDTHAGSITPIKAAGVFGGALPGGL